MPHVASKASVLQSQHPGLSQRDRMPEAKTSTSPFSILLAETGSAAPRRANQSRADAADSAAAHQRERRPAPQRPDDGSAAADAPEAVDDGDCGDRAIRCRGGGAIRGRSRRRAVAGHRRGIGTTGRRTDDAAADEAEPPPTQVDHRRRRAGRRGRDVASAPQQPVVPIRRRLPAPLPRLPAAADGAQPRSARSNLRPPPPPARARPLRPRPSAPDAAGGADRTPHSAADRRRHRKRRKPPIKQRRSGRAADDAARRSRRSQPTADARSPPTCPQPSDDRDARGAGETARPTRSTPKPNRDAAQPEHAEPPLTHPPGRKDRTPPSARRPQARSASSFRPRSPRPTAATSPICRPGVTSASRSRRPRTPRRAPTLPIRWRPRRCRSKASRSRSPRAPRPDATASRSASTRRSSDASTCASTSIAAAKSPRGWWSRRRRRSTCCAATPTSSNARCRTPA